MKTALITGITGQDGSYLAEFLLEKEYQVIGMLRYHSQAMASANLGQIKDKIHFVYGDMLDQINLSTILEHFRPDEIYNLAAPSYGPLSWDMPEYAVNVIGLGTIRLLEAMVEKCPQARFYQASSSEMFGLTNIVPQNEKTPLRPRYPYAFAKTMAHHAVSSYRQERNMYAVSGIAYNHESPRRPEWFVTRKITKTAAWIKAELMDKIQLGNLDVQRDWGYAGDYVKAMWLSLQQNEPDDYVIATGSPHTIRDILIIAFEYLDLDWQDYYEIDLQYMRSSEPHILVGDSSKIRDLGWQPEVGFKEMIEIMVEADAQEIGIK